MVCLFLVSDLAIVCELLGLVLNVLAVLPLAVVQLLRELVNLNIDFVHKSVKFFSFADQLNDLFFSVF